jgi:hypothetical protein
MANDEQTSPAVSGEANTPVMAEDIKPSFKPLLWFLGGLVLLIGLGEVLLEFGLNLFELMLDVIEHVWLVLIEAPEEFLEGLIEDWLKQHYPHDADRYSEIITAFGLTPLKILLVFLLLRWGWCHSRVKLIPRGVAWFKRRVAETRLAWLYLAWPYKVLAGIVALGVLAVIV